MDVPHAVPAPIPPYPQISADSQRFSSFIKPHQPSSTTRHFFLVWAWGFYNEHWTAAFPEDVPSNMGLIENGRFL